jgi:hypothetical protein
MDFTPAASNVIKLHGCDLVLSTNHPVGSKATITVTKDTGFDSSEIASMDDYRQKYSSIPAFSNAHHAFNSPASCFTNPGDCPRCVVELSVPKDTSFGDLHIASTGYNSISTASSSDALIFAPTSTFNVSAEFTSVDLAAVVSAASVSFDIGQGHVHISNSKSNTIVFSTIADGSLTMGTSDNTWVHSTSASACLSAHGGIEDHGSTCHFDQASNSTTCDSRALLCNSGLAASCAIQMRVTAIASAGAVSIFPVDGFPRGFSNSTLDLHSDKAFGKSKPAFSKTGQQALESAAEFAAESQIHHVQYLTVGSMQWLYATSVADVQLTPSFLWAISASVLTPRTRMVLAPLARAFCPYVAPESYSAVEFGEISDAISDIVPKTNEFVGVQHMSHETGLLAVDSYKFEAHKTSRNQNRSTWSLEGGYTTQSHSFQSSIVLRVAVYTSFFISFAAGIASFFVIVYQIMWLMKEQEKSEQNTGKYKNIILQKKSEQGNSATDARKTDKAAGTLHQKCTNALTRVHKTLTAQFAKIPRPFSLLHSTAASVLSHQQISLKEFIGELTRETTARKEGNSNASSTSIELRTFQNAYETYCHINGMQPIDLKHGKRSMQTHGLKVSVNPTDAFIRVRWMRPNEKKKANLNLKNLPKYSALDWYATTFEVCICVNQFPSI